MAKWGYYESIIVRHQDDRSKPRDRQVWAWAAGWRVPRKAKIQQLYDYPDLFDGIEVFCGGCSFAANGLQPRNETKAKDCSMLIQAAKETNTKVQLVITGRAPDSEDVGPFVQQGFELSSYFGGVDGFSLDDETDCAPRAKTDEFEKWVFPQ